MRAKVPIIVVRASARWRRMQHRRTDAPQLCRVNNTVTPATTTLPFNAIPGSNPLAAPVSRRLKTDHHPMRRCGSVRLLESGVAFEMHPSLCDSERNSAKRGAHYVLQTTECDGDATVICTYCPQHAALRQMLDGAERGKCSGLFASV